MSTNPPESPAKHNTFYQIFRYCLMPIWSRLRAWWLQWKYSGDAFDQSFDWDWKATHFNRISLVNLLVSKKPNCTYLEIGCELNDLYDSVPVLNKVGVDPQRGGSIRQTSDEFFAANKSFFDVIFVDGLHTYEQVRRDAINSIRYLKPGGWIMFHDLLPKNWIEEHVPVVSRAGDWTGDVWKLAFELAKSDGIDFRILTIDHGVGVLRLTAPGPAIVDLSSELSNKQFRYLYENVSQLPICGWDEAQDWLRNS